jgi:methyl-accepting chemotaxis protein
MIDGYEELNKHIEATINLIQDVSASTKEQMQGVEQINDAITTLDHATQQNASEANSVASVASEVRTMANALVENASAKQFN